MKVFKDSFSQMYVRPYTDKGKKKLFEGYSFNDDGILSLKAVQILHKGSLKYVSKKFVKQCIDLDI